MSILLSDALLCLLFLSVSTWVAAIIYKHKDGVINDPSEDDEL